MKNITLATLALPRITPGDQLRQLRDQFVALAGKEHGLLHGHHPDGTYDYAYPLIQYRRTGVVGIADGADLLLQVWIGRPDALGEAKLDLSVYKPALLDDPAGYYLHRWVPFNADNYARWKNMDDPGQRRRELERLLVAHILTFARAVGWFIESRLDVDISDILNVKKINMMNRKTADWAETSFVGFGVAFRTNAALPLGVGLGRGARLGYGVLEPGYKADRWKKQRQLIISGAV